MMKNYKIRGHKLFLNGDCIFERCNQWIRKGKLNIARWEERESEIASEIANFLREREGLSRDKIEALQLEEFLQP